MDYGYYQPLYERLLKQYPQICGEKEYFLFALPPVGAGWAGITDGRMYDFLDGLAVVKNGFYCGSQGSYEDNYEQYIHSLNTYGKPELQKLVTQIKADCRADTIDVFYGNNKEKRPLVSLSSNPVTDVSAWKKHTVPDFQMDFCSDEWDDDEDPVSLSMQGKTIPVSQVIKKETYSFSIRIQGVGSYEVTRGSWFHPELFSSSYTIQKGLAVTWDTFFAPFRTLCRPIGKILLIYRMSISLDFSIPMLRSAGGCGPSQLLFLGIPVEMYKKGGIPRGMLRLNSSNCAPEKASGAFVLGVTQHCYE